MPAQQGSSPIFDRPRRHSPRYATRTSTRSALLDQRTCAPPQRSPRQPHRHRSTPAIAVPQLTHLARGDQIPIEPAAPPYVPPSRFLPLEAFGRRPPNSRCRPSCGRHPKPLYGAYRCQVESGGAVESFCHVTRLHLRHGQLPCSAALSGQSPKAACGAPKARGLTANAWSEPS
jgi:hypothetical protein